MEVKQAMSVDAEAVEDAAGVTRRRLWESSDGADSFSLQLFEIPTGASTVGHSHPYEHEVYILYGRAVVRSGETDSPLNAGDTALIMPDEPHQFFNAGPTVLRFLCAAPLPR